MNCELQYEHHDPDKGALVEDVSLATEYSTRHVGSRNSKPGPKFNPDNKLRKYLANPVEAGRPFCIWQRWNQVQGRNETVVDFICRVCGEMGQQREQDFRKATSCGCAEGVALEGWLATIIDGIRWSERRDIARALESGSQHHWVSDHFSALRQLDPYTRRLAMSRIWADWKHEVTASYSDDRKIEVYFFICVAFRRGDRSEVAALAKRLNMVQADLSVIFRWGCDYINGITVLPPLRPDPLAVHLINDGWEPKMFVMPKINQSSLKSIRAMIGSNTEGEALSEMELARYKRLWARLEGEATRESKKVGRNRPTRSEKAA